MRGKLAISVLLGLGMGTLASAQVQTFFLPDRVGGPVWFLVVEKSVQTELKVTPVQAGKLQEWSTAFTEKVPELLKNNGLEQRPAPIIKDGKLDMPAMMARAKEVALLLNNAACKELGEILQKEQIDRLKQIMMQRRGIGALGDADVVKLLKFTDEQKGQVDKIMLEFAQKLPQPGFGKRGGRDARADLAKTKELEKEYLQKVVDSLTEEQKQTWKSLVGRPFDPATGAKKE